MIEQEEERRSQPGLIELLKASAGTLVSIVHNRLALASTEIEEERERLEQMVLIAVACVFCVCVGILLLTLFLVVYYWDTPARMFVLGGITLVYFIAACFLAARLRHKLKHKPRLFAATLAELYKDRVVLNGKSD